MAAVIFSTPASFIVVEPVLDGRIDLGLQTFVVATPPGAVVNSAVLQGIVHVAARRIRNDS